MTSKNLPLDQPAQLPRCPLRQNTAQPIKILSFSLPQIENLHPFLSALCALTHADEASNDGLEGVLRLHEFCVNFRLHLLPEVGAGVALSLAPAMIPERDP
jgi:hypothetical protein